MPFLSDETPPRSGWTFEVRKGNKGTYHSVIEFVEKPRAIGFTLWRDDSPEYPGLLSFEIHPSVGELELVATVQYRVPPEVIHALSPAFLILTPVVVPLSRTITRWWLRRRLREIASRAVKSASW